MSGQNIRIMKEVRGLFWPWCLVTALSMLHVFDTTQSRGFSAWMASVSAYGFFVGIPLLAVLPFGNEFQYRTISSLLAQPVGRVQIWTEKLVVMLAAAVSASFVYYIIWRVPLEHSVQNWVFSAVFLLTSVAAASLWTLVSGSIIGGVILTGAFPMLLLVIGINLTDIAVLRHQDQTETFPILVAVAVAAVCYAAIVFWLGYRKFVQLEIKGDAAGRDLMNSIPKIFPQPLAWLGGPRTRGPFLNLLGKELHLLQPVWLLTLVWFGVIACLGALRLLHVRDTLNGYIAVGAVGVYVLLVSMLAGIVSMGEERQSGTHSWHLTMPMSVFRQWLMKCVINMSAGFICGAVMIGFAAVVVGAPFLQTLGLNDSQLTTNQALDMLTASVLALTVTGFWCACAVKGTVRAAGLILPVVLAVTTSMSLPGVLSEAGNWMSRVLDYFVQVTHPFPASYGLIRFALQPGWVWVTLILGSLLLLALFQSYRMFRMECTDSLASIGRPLIQLCVLGFLVSAVQGVAYTFVSDIYRQRNSVMREVASAVGNLNWDAATLDAARPKPLTKQELASVYPLSELSRKWL
ncbi:MAG TPA: hypothetical protein VKY31_16650, partial [Terriglobia bacterium]|nr:hypothetical protein [Terriglobia bacterium]